MTFVRLLVRSSKSETVDGYTSTTASTHHAFINLALCTRADPVGARGMRLTMVGGAQVEVEMDDLDFSGLIE